MSRRRNTRINTLFSEAAYDWLKAEAETHNQSLAQIVRDKIEQVQKGDSLLERIAYLEKVIKKSHALIIERLERGQ